jgi:hypothetical protein
MENNMYTPCPCFSCGEHIDYLTFRGKNTSMGIDGAIQIIVEGSYGSKFDLSQMIIWICDECIEQKMEERVFMINEDITYDYTIGSENE